MAGEQTCEVESPLAIGPYYDVCFSFSESTKLWYSNVLYNVK
jgi:hypothetical protein